MHAARKSDENNVARKSLDIVSNEWRALERRADTVLDRALASARLRAGFIPLLDLLPALSLVAILWYGGHLAIAVFITNGRGVSRTQRAIADLAAAAYEAFTGMQLPLRS